MKSKAHYDESKGTQNFRLFIKIVALWSSGKEDISEHHDRLFNTLIVSVISGKGPCAVSRDRALQKKLLIEN